MKTPTLQLDPRVLDPGDLCNPTGSEWRCVIRTRQTDSWGVPVTEILHQGAAGDLGYSAIPHGERIDVPNFPS